MQKIKRYWFQILTCLLLVGSIYTNIQTYRFFKECEIVNEMAFKIQMGMLIDLGDELDKFKNSI